MSVYIGADTYFTNQCPECKLNEYQMYDDVRFELLGENCRDKLYFGVAIDDKCKDFVHEIFTVCTGDYLQQIFSGQTKEKYK